METNEQGLTTEERIMFSILGIILLIAVGVLILNSISSKERTLNEETPITENQDPQKEEPSTKDTTSSLIEETVVEETKTSSLSSRKTSIKATVTPTKSQYVSNKKTSNHQETPEKTTSVETTEMEWDFNENIVTEAYENDVINIDKTVLLKDGTKAEAAVTIRKQIENTYVIEKITDNQFVVTEGNYKYYYTYGNKTKEINLTVKKELPITDVTFLKITTEETEEITNMKNTLANSIVEYKENTIHIELHNSTSSKIPIVINLPEELAKNTIMATNEYVSISKENRTWYQELTATESILWLDCDNLNTETELTLWIDGHNYGIFIMIEKNIDEPEEEEEEKEEIQKEEETEQTSPEESKPSQETIEETAEQDFAQENITTGEPLEISNIEVDPIT